MSDVAKDPQFEIANNDDNRRLHRGKGNLRFAVLRCTERCEGHTDALRVMP